MGIVKGEAPSIVINLAEKRIVGGEQVRGGPARNLTGEQDAAIHASNALKRAI